MFFKSKIKFLLCSLSVLNFCLLYAPSKQELKGKVRALSIKKTKAAKEQEEEELLAQAAFEVSREVSLAAVVKPQVKLKRDDILQLKELFDAIILNDISKVKKFLDQNPRLISARNKDDVTAFMLAVEMNNNNIVQILLDKGIDVNAPISDDGYTALMLATLKGYADMVCNLLDKGADPNLQDKKGETALMIASNDGRADLMRMFLDKKANLDLQKNNGGTALMLAAQFGWTDLVRMLLDKGVNLNIQEKNTGGTALMFAVSADKKDIVQILLDAGSNFNLKTKQGSTALMVAEKMSSDDIVRMLKIATLEQSNKNNLLQISYQNWQGLTKVKALERNKIQKEKDEQQIREQILHEERRLVQDLFAQEEEGFVNLDPISKLQREVQITNWADEWGEIEEQRFLNRNNA